MNTKLYWIIRNWWIKFSFFLKKRWFSTTYKSYNEKKTKSFSFLIIKTVILQSLKAMLMCVIVLFLDHGLLCITKQESLDHQIFLDIVIGGIGVAGVILGLYCSNMASMFSSKYTNAPESINKLYQRDIVTNKCVKQIVSYITFCIALLAVCITEIDFSFITVVLLLLLTIRTIITFSISGNRAYNLSNTYRIADIVYPDILHMIDKLTERKGIDGDKNFQYYYRKTCYNYLGVLRDIAVYNKSNSENQTAPIITFLKNNLTVLFAYVKKKPYIPYNSCWFAEKTQYQQWHTASDMEISTKIKFGLMLDTKNIKDYMWFESEFEKVNQVCLDVLLKAGDYSSIYNYLAVLSNLSEGITDINSIAYWNQYIKSLKESLLPIISKNPNIQTIDDNVAGIADAYAAVCFNFVISICSYIDKLDIDSIFNYAVSKYDYKNIDFHKGEQLNNAFVEDLYHRIEAEVKIEEKRITPPWYIEQIVAQKLFDHLNLLTAQMADMFEFSFSVGDKILSAKSFYNAAIWFCRLSELQAKIARRRTCEKIINLEKLLIEKKKDPKVIWNDSDISQSLESITNITRIIPQSLKKCSGIFAITHQEKRTEFPGLLGYCYNRFCDCMITSIANDDVTTFKSLYEGFLGTMLLYQEYIRTDLIKRKEEHLQKAVLHVFSAPVLEFAMISGLAILWGEFVDSKEWRAIVEKEIEPYTDTSKEDKHRVLPHINQVISARKGTLLGISNRDIIETGWEQMVSAAIRNHPKYKIAYGKFGQKYIVSDSRLFSVFTRHSLAELGVIHDIEELFCVLCVNPHVQENEKYHTRSKWEEIVNNEDEQ